MKDVPSGESHELISNEFIDRLCARQLPPILPPSTNLLRATMHYRHFLHAAACCVIVLTSRPPNAAAQIPTIDRLVSKQLVSGGKAEVRAVGKDLKDVERLWLPFAELPFIAAEKPDEKQAAFQGTVPESVQPGIYEARVITKRGVSARHWLVVDSLPETITAAGSEAQASPTMVPSSCVVQGLMNARKPRYFGVELKAQQTLQVEAVARRLNSALDPVVRILQADGKELAFADDTPGLTGDAWLQFSAPQDGVYTIEVRDVQYTGGSRHFFHLRIGGSKLPVSETRNAALTAVGIASPALEEVEPNNSAAEATAVEATTQRLSGVIQQPGDIDVFKIRAEAASHLCVTALTRRLGSPADVVLELSDENGKTLKSADETGSYDAQLAIALPAAGNYFLTVQELSSLSGPAFTYDLQLQWGGRTEVATAVDSVAIPETGAASIAVTVNRIGHSEPLEIWVDGLPAGVVSTPAVVVPNQKTAVITLQNTDKASSTFQTPIQILTRRSADAPPVPVAYQPAVKPVTDAAYEIPRLSAGLFIFGTAPPEFSLSATPQTLNIKPGDEIQLTVSATRTDEWTQPIDLASAVPAAELPTGITLGTAKLEKDSIPLSIKAAASTVPGRYSLSLQGTLKKDKTTIVRPLPTLTLEVTDVEKTVATD